MSKRILHRMSACLLAAVVSLTVGGCDAKISMNGLLVSQSEEETKTDTSKADKNVSSVPETETSSTAAAPESPTARRMQFYLLKTALRIKQLNRCQQCILTAVCPMI